MPAEGSGRHSAARVIVGSAALCRTADRCPGPAGKAAVVALRSANNRGIANRLDLHVMSLGRRPCVPKRNGYVVGERTAAGELGCCGLVILWFPQAEEGTS